ncbi:MAG: DUF4260 family protein [Kiloniellaceae bacterium]
MNRKAEFDYTDGSYATGQVERLLRVEALAILAASTTLFFFFGGELWIFAVLFFAPDLSFVGYAVSRKAGGGDDRPSVPAPYAGPCADLDAARRRGAGASRDAL